jgi:hypothetical protein
LVLCEGFSALLTFHHILTVVDPSNEKGVIGSFMILKDFMHRNLKKKR